MTLPQQHPHNPPQTPWLALLLFGLALGYYGWQVSRSPLVDRDLAARQQVIGLMLQHDGQRAAQDRQAAELYWQSNPDVAADPVYGRAGRLGAGGAYEHFRRHGRFEGRTWPSPKPE